MDLQHTIDPTDEPPSENPALTVHRAYSVDVLTDDPVRESTPPLAVCQSIFRSMQDAILVIGPNSTIEHVNPAAVRQTGYPEDELIGQPLSLLTRHSRVFSRTISRALSRDSFADRIEATFVRKDGSRFSVSLAASKIYDPERDHECIVCVARDISRRKRLVAESQAMAKIIHGLASTGNVGELLQLVHSSIKRIVYAENFFVALFDPESEMLTMQFWVDKHDPMPPPQRLGRSMSAYIYRTGQPMIVTQHDTERLVREGHIENVGTDSPSWLGVPLTTPAGTIGVLVVQDYTREGTYCDQDVTFLTAVADQIALALQRKKAEDELRHSKDRLELVTRGTSDAVWDWDLVTNELWWNEGFQKLFGYSKEETESSLDFWAERLHPDDVERVSRDMFMAIESGRTNWTDEYRFRRRDGTYAFVIDRGYVVHDENGKAVRMLGSMMDVTERKSLENQLMHQALHDPLTSIPNRVLFRDRVDHALAKRARENSMLAVLFLDLDNFKAINDGMGHLVGDKLLVSVAERLQDCLRTTDTAARLGGDEFAVLVESIGRFDEAVMIAGRILDVFRQPFIIDGSEIHVKTSIGIAGSSDDETDTDVLLRNADLAMYLAKSQGKGTYVIFEPKMHEALMERIELEADLRRGIEAKEFLFHYQPIFDLRTNKLQGMEALVRWQHPKYGLLGPMRFIPLAEETNLIVPLGERIIREACRQLQEWREQNGPDMDISVSVNMSIRQFQEAELVDKVRKALKDTGLPAKCLILEITESFMMQNTESTIMKLQDLKDLGVRLAIDDFGTGYSSLSYLQRFPVDILKIDKSFVDKLGLGSEGNAVAKAIIQMGDSLGLRTVAEGIEQDHQLDDLRELGCESGQGYHFAKPMPKEDMEKFLKLHI